MDVEAELIHSEKWIELRKYYSAKAGHDWELGWIHWLRTSDLESAISHFSRCLRDPHYAEAAYVLLWKLGRKPVSLTLNLPLSLRIFEAEENGAVAPVLLFLEKAQANEIYAPALIERIVDHLKERDLTLIDRFPRPANLSLKIAQHCDHHWKNHSIAKKYYDEFFSDPWTRRAQDEAERHIFDESSSKRVRFCYSERDGTNLKRILKALLLRLSKPSERKLSAVWKEAFELALEQDLQNVTENVLGYPFWNQSSLSPSALESVRRHLFSPEKNPEPDFLKTWQEFFGSPELKNLSANLEPDRLSLWQIRVELNSQEFLPEALLRFPDEERFLFLWSISQRKKVKADRRKWPENTRESDVVRKNLERAFEKSTDKLLWFGRLRELGCSQDFYEYALTRLDLPVSWIVDDLKNHFIDSTPEVRAYLRRQLSLAQPIEPAELTEALSFLTPAETQQILLSRFVLSDIPSEVLTDEALDLFWDARAQVSQEVSRRWREVVLKHLERVSVRALKSRHWLWIEDAWNEDPASLDRFGPEPISSREYPWEVYLEKLERHGLTEKLLRVLPEVPDPRLKENWIRLLMEKDFDPRLEASILSMDYEHLRYGLLADWLERKGDYGRAIEIRKAELDSHPILNEQLRAALQILKGFQMLEAGRDEVATNNDREIRLLIFTSDFLMKNGGLTSGVCEDIASIFIRYTKWDQAWKWLIAAWARAKDSQREELLSKVLEMAFRGRIIDETQRFLVDFIFQDSSPGRLKHEIISALLDEDSPFRLKHLRKEFIDRASQIYPLHREVLRTRSEYDCRATLLWDCFYGEDLSVRAEFVSYSKKRRYELWNITAGTHLETLIPFAKYFHRQSVEAISGVRRVGAASKKVEHPFFEKAIRQFQRSAKFYSMKKKVTIELDPNLSRPLEMGFDPHTIKIQVDFFNQLDEETWASISVGFLQILFDRDKGLFDEKRLIERFFQGMLLSGVPIAKQIRLWVWLAIYEGQIEPQVLKLKPEDLIEKLPFVNSLLTFYLSHDYSQKMEECGINPT